MAESLAEKLKRIAREKREAQEKLAAAVTVDAVVAAPVDTAVANDQPKVEEVSDEPISDREAAGKLDSRPSGTGSETGSSIEESGTVNTKLNEDPVPVETSGVVSNINFIGCDGSETDLTLQPTPSNHPLAMQFAEMEQALLSADPTFKTILRDVHRHLGKDPALVTLMTEEEVAMVVKGLVVFANAEVVEPAKAKAVKAGVAAAKKKVISVDDL